jgi:aminoglycoside 3-N-acetyltransferase
MAGPPVSTDSLTADLRALGVRSGTTMIVHSSLSSLGWVIGDTPAVIAALTAALGPDGTLAMPAHSGGLSDPARWVAPPVPVEWHNRIRAEMPAYDPAITPTHIMGAIPESFRTHPNVRRSAHPRQSFAARGKKAAFITGDHALDCAMGERSPLARLHDLDADVLLLGVAHDRNTSLHLAEYRARWPSKRYTTFGSPVVIDGKRRWLEVDDLDFDDSDFARLGEDFERDTEAVLVGKVGAAPARLMRQRALVDYAVDWIGRLRR